MNFKFPQVSGILHTHNPLRRSIKPLVLFFIAACITSGAGAQLVFRPNADRPVLLRQKCLGGTGNDIANAMVPVPGGGAVLAGTSGSNDGDVTGHHGTTAFNDGWVVKLDSANDIEWQISLGGTANDDITGIIQTTDGGFLCVGTTQSADGDILQNRGGSDVWLVKLTATGTLEWSRTYGGSGTDLGVSVIQLPGNEVNYIVSATTDSRDGDAGAADTLPDTNGWFFKINGSGDILWQTSIDQGGIYANRDNGAVGLVAMQDGNLLACITGYGKRDTIFIEYNNYTESFDTTRFSDNTYPGLLYRINVNTGSAEYFTQTSGTPNCMFLSMNDIYFSYADFGAFYFQCQNDDFPYNTIYYPYNVWVISRLDAQTGTFSNWSKTFDELICPSGSSSGYSEGYGPSKNGLGVIPGQPWITAGQHTSSTRGGTFSWDARIMGPEIWGNYGGINMDGFNAVSPLPGGDEFICAGYTNSTQFNDGGFQANSDVTGLHGAPVNGSAYDYPSDFWVVKLSRLIATWTGAIDTAWENPGNWSTHAVPNKITKAIIPANRPHYPVVNSNAVCFILQVDRYASIRVNTGFELNISGK